MASFLTFPSYTPTTNGPPPNRQRSSKIFRTSSILGRDTQYRTERTAGRHHPSGSGWVELRSPRPETLRQVEKELTEGRGEKEAIALALDLSALVVLDDKRARNYARRVGLRLTGTLGVLLRLHHLGLAERELEADIALLDEADMRITPELRRMVLDARSEGGLR